MNYSLFGLFPIALMACQNIDENTGPDTEVWQTEGFTLGEEIRCEDPAESGFLRFEEQSQARGLILPFNPEGYGVGPPTSGVVMKDLDGDGDLDLAMGHMVDRRLYFFENDGTGHFSEHAGQRVDPTDAISDVNLTRFVNAGFADMMGDPLPDLLLVYDGGVALFENQGDFRFGAGREIFHDPTEPELGMNHVTWADVDQDGDLDVFVPTFATSTSSEVEVFPRHVPSLDRLLMNEDGIFSVAYTLPLDGQPTNANLAMFTDRDGDGDADLLVPTDYAEFTLPTAFYRNDGPEDSSLPVLQDDAAEVSADLQLYGMGVDSADLDGDGFLDYCIASFGPLVCITNDGTGQYVDMSAAYGMTAPEHVAVAGSWSLWSIELADLDNDAHLDVIAAAGTPWKDIDMGLQPNNIWQGDDEGTFLEMGDAFGFDADGSTYGLVTGDIDGDGYLEFIFNGTDHDPELWSNQCDENAWIEVDLLGVFPNREAYGARIETIVDGTHQIREISSMRLGSQSPSLVHFGLGNASRVDTLIIRWPDGLVTTAENVPTRRRLLALHPDANEIPDG